MRRFHRAAMLAALLALAPVLTACENFDHDKLDVFGLNKKKPLPGDRKPLFPEGVPGVTQGIPPEYMKGNTAEQPGAAIAVAAPPAAAAAQPPAEQQPKAKPKPKPKPRQAARKPTQVTVQPPTAAQPAPAAQQPAPPPWPAPAQQQPQQSQPAQSSWPTPTQAAPAPWPSAPPPGTFSKQ